MKFLFYLCHFACRFLFLFFFEKLFVSFSKGIENSSKVSFSINNVVLISRVLFQIIVFFSLFFILYYFGVFHFLYFLYSIRSYLFLIFASLCFAVSYFSSFSLFPLLFLSLLLFLLLPLIVLSSRASSTVLHSCSFFISS